MNKNGIAPDTIPPILYCKKHGYYINMQPSVKFSMDQGFRVVCPDCGAFGHWEKTVKESIEAWNKNCGISA
jgi:hypothetical protein